MNSDWIESELQECLSELRSICDHLEPPPGGWQKFKHRCCEWWSEYSDAAVGGAFWLLIIGGPMLLSRCSHKKRLEPPESPHGDVVAQYNVGDYAEDVEEREENKDEDEEVAVDENNEIADDQEAEEVADDE